MRRIGLSDPAQNVLKIKMLMSVNIDNYHNKCQIIYFILFIIHVDENFSYITISIALNPYIFIDSGGMQQITHLFTLLRHIF